jgi:Cu+-exporting ATPase
MNQTGSFRFRATRIGRTRRSSRSSGWQRRARRAPIARLADAISAYFTPAVISVAVLTFVIWATCSRGDPAHHGAGQLRRRRS